MCVGKTSPNHNTANYALELAGLRASKHVRKASEIVSICFWVQVGVRTPDCALGADCKSKTLYSPPGPKQGAPGLKVQQSQFSCRLYGILSTPDDLCEKGFLFLKEGSHSSPSSRLRYSLAEGNISTILPTSSLCGRPTWLVSWALTHLQL